MSVETTPPSSSNLLSPPSPKSWRPSLASTSSCTS
eukprot:CAMPEP_0201667100 /NCGR_PEP_ID=MMETSP0494-20130426/11782_1 /ASSEMBLY_ACC=CAM_ASM_000839 /TAXON_ID=420259 /ORGANISM="Thalassiosira gravida, Strain GMp14c1" /LENGTH=34 /DNA_ID= /DNA_START= /DNA_END= /DNA_ORIENTATION=